MRKVTKLLPAIILSTTFASQGGLADQGQFYLAPGAQWMDFDNGLNLGEDTGYFFGLGYDFTDRLSVELSTFDLDGDAGPGVDFDLDNYKLDVLYNLNGGDRRVSTFVISGIGNTNFSGDNDSLWDVGGGINIKLTENLSWRTAVRNYMYLDRDHEDSDVGVDSALVYRFGGNKRQRPVAAAPAPAPAPAPVDSDGDGVPDSRDRCPDTPRNYAVDSDGCPIPVEEIARVELQVNFDFDQSVVKPEFFSEIERIAVFMRQYPDVIVELEGHTDSTGTDEYNLGLSDRRASAVRQVLIDRFNVQASRVSARGFGESQPIASNDTPAGRAQNRRVMTVIIKTLQNYQPR